MGFRNVKLDGRCFRWRFMGIGGGGWGIARRNCFIVILVGRILVSLLQSSLLNKGCILFGFLNPSFVARCQGVVSMRLCFIMGSLFWNSFMTAKLDLNFYLNRLSCYL